MGKFLSWLAVLLFAAGSVCTANAQDLFANSYGGTGTDWAYVIQQTPDGGYVLCGPASSFGAGQYDFWIAKLDASGVVVWQKAYGGSLYDIPNALQQTADGGFIVAGRTQSFGAGGFDAWVLKLDASGERVWQKTYGGSGDYDAAYSVHQTPDGGYTLAGWTNSYGAGSYDYWVLKLDADGNSVWQRTLGGSSADTAYASCLTTDGGLVVAGGGNVGAGGYDVWVVKLDGSGNSVWQKAFGGTKDDLAFSIRQTSDDGFIVTGFTLSYGAGSNDLWVLKLDSGGGLQWQKTYGGSALDWGFAVQQTGDGGYLVAGRTVSFGAGNEDAWILKLDASGNVSWQKTYGGSLLDYAYCVWEAADGSYLVGGVTASFGAGGYDAMVLRLEPSCLLGAVCAAMTVPSVTPGTPSPTTTTTARTPGVTSSVPGTTVPSSSSATASRTLQCSYPTLPDDDALTLFVTREGDAPRLSWSAPGGACTVTSYGVYRGGFPIFPYNHEALDCAVPDAYYVDSTAGDLQYYILVPNNAYLEGSFGTSFDGATYTERPPGVSPCRPQCLLPCP